VVHAYKRLITSLVVRITFFPHWRPTDGAAAQISSPRSPTRIGHYPGAGKSRREKDAATTAIARGRAERETEDAGLANESYKRSSRASDWRKMEDAFVSGRARGVVSEARPDPPMATPLLRLRE